MAWLTRLRALLASAACALGCAVFVGWLCLQPIVQSLSVAWAVRDWRPVPAEVLALEWRDVSSERERRALYARYRYAVDGVSIEGERIGLSPHCDTDPCLRWHDHLQAARAGKLRLLAYFDPAQPSRAVLERSIDWEAIALDLAGAAVFLVLFCHFLFELFERAGLNPRRAARIEIWVTRGMLLAWCGFSWPLMVWVWASEAAWLPRVGISLLAIGGLLGARVWRRGARIPA